MALEIPHPIRSFVTRHPWWSALLVLIVASIPSPIPYVGAALTTLILIGGVAGVVIVRQQAVRGLNSGSTPAAIDPAGDSSWASRRPQGYGLQAQPFPRAGRSFRSEPNAPTLHQMVTTMRLEPPREPLEEQVEVAGETHHTKDIRRVFTDAGMPITEKGSTLTDLQCVLVPEPWNEHDPNAVAVVIGHHHVGYLPADLAAEYAGPLGRLASDGHLVTGIARVWVKSDGGMVRARVTALLPSAECL